MMRFIWITLLVLFVSGCDTMNHNQLLVRVSSNTKPQAAVETKIVAVLSSFAEENGFLNKTNESKVVGTLVYFKSNNRAFPILLGARKITDGVVVDLLHFHPGSGEEDAYSKIKNELLALLKREFGASVISVPYGQQYEIVHKNP